MVLFVFRVCYRKLVTVRVQKIPSLSDMRGEPGFWGKAIKAAHNRTMCVAGLYA